MADASNNSPKKELLLTLVGVGMFIAIAALIGLSGALRPAADEVIISDAAERDAALRAQAAEYAQVVTGAVPTDEAPEVPVDDAMVETAEGAPDAAQVQPGAVDAPPVDPVALPTTESVDASSGTAVEAPAAVVGDNPPEAATDQSANMAMTGQ